MIWLLISVLLLVGGGFSHRYAWWRPVVDYRQPRILMYHMISDHKAGAKFNKLRVPPAMFERQVCWLKDQGWHFALMSELQCPGKLPEKSVFLTFDDGFEDNFTAAHPVLQRYNAKATLYLVEDRFERDWSTSKKVHHDSGELMRESKVTDQQIEQMLTSGCWELGGHTRTHVNLSKLSDAEKASEIGGAKQSLEDRFGVVLSSFAYPFGIYDQRDVKAAAEAGFFNSVTTVEGISDISQAAPHELSRIKISGKDNWLAFLIRIRTGRRGWKK